MGKIVVTEFISMDGVMEAPGGGEDFKYGGWSFAISRGKEGDQFKLDEAFRAEALLLGRVTYQAFAAAWPSRTGEFADKFNNMPKYVVSSTLKDAGWKNTTVLRGNAFEEISKLKQALKGEIVVHGSAKLVQTLIEHDLATPDGLPRGSRNWQAPLRRHERQEELAPGGVADGRRRRLDPHLPVY